MANLKDIRVRMASVESTQKITSAMKMVSAAKLRRAQNTILKLRPYANELSAILADLMSTQSDGDANPLEEVRAPERVVLVVITS
ncbi:MAG: F0F1 ATP synthase subunit gamma, partial [Bacteroidales bacterium]|nr:F0F1 ATP synthase subunit gamma [Bacteroidales bacterium]